MLLGHVQRTVEVERVVVSVTDPGYQLRNRATTEKSPRSDGNERASSPSARHSRTTCPRNSDDCDTGHPVVSAYRNRSLESPTPRQRQRRGARHPGIEPAAATPRANPTVASLYPGGMPNVAQPALVPGGGGSGRPPCSGSGWVLSSPTYTHPMRGCVIIVADHPRFKQVPERQRASGRARGRVGRPAHKLGACLEGLLKDAHSRDARGRAHPSPAAPVPSRRQSGPWKEVARMPQG